MNMQKRYCEKCGGCGVLLDGSLCSCQLNTEEFFGSISSIDIPELYQGKIFNKLILPRNLPAEYGTTMQEIYDNVTSLRWKAHNVVLCSPPGSGKSTLAYSCIESLFRKGLPVLTLYDLFELKRIILDYDNGRKIAYDVTDPEYVVKSPYLFVRIPRTLSFDTYDCISYLLDKRVRRNGSTFFLFNGTWEQLIALDKNNVLNNLVGDGSYGTVERSSWEYTQLPQF